MSNAVTLNYEEHGKSADSADTIVLIHGLFGDLDNLKSISRALQEAYHVVNIDLRNHGSSPWTKTMQLSEMAADVAALLATLKVEKAHILGHSLGGKVAMEFALEHPQQVRSLMIADIAPVAYDARHNSILSALESLELSQLTSRQDADRQLAEHIESAGVRMFLLKNLRKTENGWAWRMNLAGLRACYADLIAAPTQQGSFTKPVLFIRGGDSDYIQEQHREAITSRFSQVDLKTIAGTGHWLHAEKPTVFNGIVERFLAANSGA